jgi:hypothetical protein
MRSPRGPSLPGLRRRFEPDGQRERHRPGHYQDWFDQPSARRWLECWCLRTPIRGDWACWRRGQAGKEPRHGGQTQARWSQAQQPSESGSSPPGGATIPNPAPPPKPGIKRQSPSRTAVASVRRHARSDIECKHERARTRRQRIPSLPGRQREIHLATAPASPISTRTTPRRRRLSRHAASHRAGRDLSVADPGAAELTQSGF